MSTRDLTIAERQDAEEDDRDNPLRAPELRMRRPNDYSQTREIASRPAPEDDDESD